MRKELTVTSLFVLWGSLVLSSCATTREPGWSKKWAGDQLSLSAEQQLLEKGLTHWKKRHNRGELDRALESFERVAQSNPSHYQALMLLSRGYHLLGRFHLGQDGRPGTPIETQRETQKNAFQKGLTWGERALASRAPFREQVRSGTAIDIAARSLERSEVDALYWTAMNLSDWSELDGIATALKYKSTIRKLIRRVGELDPNYYYGAVHRFWGEYYAVAPFFAGGSLKRSLASFKQSMEVAGQYLGNRVRFAERYCVREENRDLFVSELKRVIEAKNNTLPDVIPEQILEQQRAKRLLSRTDQLF